MNALKMPYNDLRGIRARADGFRRICNVFATALRPLRPLPAGSVTVALEGLRHA